MKTTLKDIKNSQVEADIILDDKEISEAKKEALLHLGKDATIKGFRKGKAPLDLLAANLDPDKIKHHALHHLLDIAVAEVVRVHKLTLITNPILTNFDDKDDSSWSVTISFPLLPIIKLEDYKKDVKKAISTKDFNKLNYDQKVEKVCNSLLDSVKFEIPQSLVDREVDQSLSRLIKQTETLGLTVEKYLESLKKTPEQLKTEYETTATNSIKLEFILLEISKDLKISVSDEDIAQMLNSIGDEPTKKQLSSPGQRSYLESILLKRKSIDELLKL